MPLNYPQVLPTRHRRSSILYFATVSFVVYVFLYALNIGQVCLDLDVESSVAGESRLFSPIVQNVAQYSGDYTSSTGMAFGRHLLSFRLPRLESPIRWDPPDSPGSYTIYSAVLRTGPFSLPLSKSSIRAARHIQSITKKSDCMVIQSTADATDPQLLFSFDVDALKNARRAYCAFLALLLTGALIYTKGLSSRDSHRTTSAPSSATTGFAPSLVPSSYFIYLLALAATLLLHGFQATHYSLTIDDEYAFYRTDPSRWVADGRWLAYLIERYLIPTPSVPFLPDLLLSAALAYAALTITKTHEVLSYFHRTLLLIIFVASPFWYYISEFYSNIPSLAVGLCFIAIAHHDFYRLFFAPDVSQDPKNVPLPIARLALSSLLVAAAIGAYQSLFLVYLAMGVGVILAQAVGRHAARMDLLVPSIVTHLLTTLSAIALYFFIDQAFRHLIQPPASVYIDNFWRISSLLHHPGVVLGKIADLAIAIYSGDSSAFASPLWASGGLVALTGYLLLHQGFQGGISRRFLLLFALIALLMLCPFAIHFATGGVGTMRTLLCVPYVVWFFASISLTFSFMAVRVVVTCLAVILTFQLVICVSKYDAISNLAQEHDRALAHSLYIKIVEATPDFSPYRAIQVDFFGTAELQNSYPSVSTTAIASSFFSWNGGYEVGRKVLYMRLLGYTNIYPTTVEKSKELTSFYEKMTIWPAAGSVRNVGGVVLVKLGPVPDRRRM